MTTPLRDFLSHYLSEPMSAGTMYYAAKVRLLKWRDRARINLLSTYRELIEWVSESREPVRSTRPIQLAIANAKLLRLKDTALIAISAVLAVSLVLHVGQVVVFQAASERIQAQTAERIAYQRRLHGITLASLHSAMERLEMERMRAHVSEATRNRHQANVDLLKSCRDQLALRDAEYDHEVLGIAIRAAETYGLDWYEAGQLAEAE